MPNLNRFVSATTTLFVVVSFPAATMLLSTPASDAFQLLPLNQSRTRMSRIRTFLNDHDVSKSISPGKRRQQQYGTGLQPQTQQVLQHRYQQLPEEDASSFSSSSHFYSRKELQDFFTSNTEETDTFQRLCRGAGLVRPSKIQSLAWPALATQFISKTDNPQAVVIADQTGSGKTLAYLIPLLHRLITTSTSRTIEDTAAATTTISKPRLLILAPTAELADQIYAVCEKVASPESHNSNNNNNNNNDKNKNKNNRDTKLFSTIVLTSSGQRNTNIRDQIRLLQLKKNNVDVLISTPGRIATILRTRKASEKVLDLSHLQALVLDEVDVLLLDETFGPQLQTVGEATTGSTDHSRNNNLAKTMQFVFVTATLPDSVVQQISQQFPGNVQLIKGPGLHRVAPTVQETLVDVSVPATLHRNPRACWEAKADALQSALRQNRCRRTLIFCNSVESCRNVENLLHRTDSKQKMYHIGAYHNAMTAQSRNENLTTFAQATEIGLSYLLVCTDRAARGVDFDASSVDHVVLLDFPTDPAEYVRRVGRTARAGRAGATTVLAYGWQLPIARSVMNTSRNHRSKKALTNYRDNMDLSGGRNDEESKDGFDNDGTEFRGGVKGRRRQIKRSDRQISEEKNSIEANIARGKLWGER